MCTVLLPPGGYPIVVNKYVIFILPFVPKGSATSDNFGEDFVTLVILCMELMVQGSCRNTAAGYSVQPLCSHKSARVVLKVMY
jgi:hypothetical protein